MRGIPKASRVQTFRIPLLSTLLVCAVASAEARPLKVGFSYWFPCVPLAIAEDRGYWRDAGLEVEIVPFAASSELAAAMAAGEIDVGYEMLGTWADAIAGGAPYLILGETDWSSGGDKLLLAADKKLEDLRGSALGVYFDSPSVTFFLRAICRDKGIAMSNFRIEEIEDNEAMAAAFASGRLSAVITYDPYASQLEAAGAVAVATTADYPGVMPEGWAMRREALASFGDEPVRMFFEGWFRAVEFLHDPANAETVAALATEKTFGGTETIAVEDVAALQSTAPVHDADKAWKRNAVVGSGVWSFARQFSGFLRQSKQVPVEFKLEEYLHVQPLSDAAGARLGGAVAKH
ncbi:hypothetical protein ASA1KI_04400 [Opitutales bacterium ASA1]|uniref:ABC transporter substrate-binding protein n=1 Tax=Congregicoccus parvus TaxID=3081749 RepID=UPI002B2B9260|nr:hypothetical protein ASA1KI_04400 [Opitutales bacterium ASA1]